MPIKPKETTIENNVIQPTKLHMHRSKDRVTVMEVPDNAGFLVMTNKAAHELADWIKENVKEGK